MIPLLKIIATLVVLWIILCMVGWVLRKFINGLRWDGNTYDLDEMDLRSKQMMAEEELKQK